jgi:hypothetical protein
MSRILTNIAQNMLTDQNLKVEFIFLINTIDYSSSLINWNVSYDSSFGAASAQFTLHNKEGIYGDGGINEINIGDTVELKEKFTGDTYTYTKFYGIIKQRNIVKSDANMTIALNCFDYISTLQYLDLDLEVEGDKVEVIGETLLPNYLPSPNASLAQVFDFTNDQLATSPEPIIIIKNKDTNAEDPQYDGFEITYSVGQLRLGFPLNALYNYDLIAKSYWFYTQGIYVEDILERILTQIDGYGQYLFGETSAQDVIDNHLTTTFLTETNESYDTLLPNYTANTIIIKTKLNAVVTLGDSFISVLDTTGFPDSGTGNINGDTFTWTGKTPTTLTGIPASGSDSLLAHKIDSYVEYSTYYSPGQVWYLTYSNVLTDLIDSDFSIPSGTSFKYFDKRKGRLLLETAINTSSIVTCDTNYTFKTLQATDIELNQITFRSREIENRFEAINKLRQYLAPNYIVRTIGDNKIWASYLYQKIRADYTLELITNLNYLEDEDIFTRIIMYGKNNNPTNLIFQDGVDFITSGESYKATTTNTELYYTREEGNYFVFNSVVSDVGKVTANIIKPIVYVNGVAIDNTSHLQISEPIIVEVTTKTETTVSGGGK